MLIELQSEVLRKREKNGKRNSKSIALRQPNTSDTEKDPIRLDFPLKCKYNNNIQPVIYKLFSCSPNIPRGFITCTKAASVTIRI